MESANQDIYDDFKLKKTFGLSFIQKFGSVVSVNPTAARHVYTQEINTIDLVTFASFNNWDFWTFYEV